MLSRRLELRYDVSHGCWVYYESGFTESHNPKYKPVIYLNLGNSGLYHDVYAPISKIKYWKKELCKYAQKKLLEEYTDLVTKIKKFNDFMIVGKEDKPKHVFKRRTKNK